MAGTVGDQGYQYLCPLPKWVYPKDSPCAHTDELHVGENDPAIDQAEQERLHPTTNTAGFPWWMYAGLGLVVVYLGIRGLEVVARIRESWNRGSGI